MMLETERGWIDLSMVPRRGNFLNWNESVGAVIPFCHRGILGEVHIKEKVSEQYVRIDIPGHVEDAIIYVGQIKHNRLGNLVGVVTREFRCAPGDIIGNIKIIDAIFKPDKHDKKYYRCKCLKDGYEWELRESHILAGIGCPVCAGKAVIRGYNDIATERPDLIKYFLNPEDACAYRTHSNKYVDFKCPHCGLVKKRQIQDAINRGFSCPRCGDGKSYPNKFVFNVLFQLLGEDEFEAEYVFEWSKSVPVPWKPEGKKMIYDIYLPGYGIIVENHGEQHYRLEGFNGKLDGQRIQENDKAKRDIALRNNITHYVELDCRKSDEQFIRRSIMDSMLPNILGFSEDDIDWASCDEYASGSLLVKSCDMWRGGEHDKNKIAQAIHIHPGTVSKYLTKGRKLGLIAS